MRAGGCGASCSTTRPDVSESLRPTSNADGRSVSMGRARTPARALEAVKLALAAKPRRRDGGRHDRAASHRARPRLRFSLAQGLSVHRPTADPARRRGVGGSPGQGPGRQFDRAAPDLLDRDEPFARTAKVDRARQEPTRRPRPYAMRRIHRLPRPAWFSRGTLQGGLHSAAPGRTRSPRCGPSIKSSRPAIATGGGFYLAALHTNETRRIAIRRPCQRSSSSAAAAIATTPVSSVGSASG